MSIAIDTLVKSGALEKVHNSPSFTSPMFLTSKSDGSLRPIFNLRLLNKFVIVKKFKLINMQKVPNFLQPYDYLAKIDLSNAYFHVPIAASHRRFLRVIYNQTLYQMTCLPFGLATAPQVFAMLSNWVAQTLRDKGIRVISYLDDFLIANQNQTALASQIEYTVDLLQNLGWQINLKKSILTPQKGLEFLGICWDPWLGLKWLPLKKTGSILKKTLPILQKKKICTSTRNPKSCRAGKLRQLCGPARALELSRTTSFLQFFNKTPFLSALRSPKRSTSRPKMVDKKLQCAVPFTSPSSQTFSLDGRFRNSMGCSNRQSRSLWSLGTSRTAFTFEPEGNAGSALCIKRSRSLPSQLYSYASDRQQNCRFIFEKRRWLKVPRANASCSQDLRPPRHVRYKSHSAPYTGENELRGRSSLSLPVSPGMAFITRDNSNNFRQMGNPRYRFDGVQFSSCRAILREPRHERRTRSVPRCFQPGMEFSSSVGVPTSFSHPQDSGPLKLCPRSLPNRGSSLGESILEARHQTTSPVPALHNSSSPSSTGGHGNRAGPSESQRNDSTSLEMWGWSSTLKDWTFEQMDLLKSGWRSSSLKTYENAWKKWLDWCKINNLKTPSNPTGSQFARFLSDLFQKHKLSYNTILVYKSAISTLCNPDLSERLSSHILVKKILLSISNKQPKQISKPPIWDVDDLSSWLLSNDSNHNNLYQCSRRAATLLLLCSGRRVHDLTLLTIDNKHCVISDDSIVFWPRFGSKTDKSDVRQSGWRLRKNTQHKNIDPVYWVRQVIRLSAERRARCNSDSLFITACGEPKPASRAVIGGWVRRLLQEAGIKASAGSVRTAVASKNWVLNCSLDEILARDNWRSQETFKKYYCREIKSKQNQTNVVSAMFSPIAN